MGTIIFLKETNTWLNFFCMRVNNLNSSLGHVLTGCNKMCVTFVPPNNLVGYDKAIFPILQIETSYANI